MIRATNGPSGKPSRAHSIAGWATSANPSVPKCSSAVIQASGAAGTTVRRSPSGMSPPHRSRKNSSVAPRGQTPSPEIVVTARRRAS